MPTLRDHVRQALAAREPKPPETTSDLDAVLARARATSPRRLPMAAWVVVLAAALVVGWVVLPKTKQEPMTDRTLPPPRVESGVHLYLHIAGEPEDRAVALHLKATSTGDPR